MNGMNLAVFTDCRVVQTWRWQDGSLVARCQIPAPADDRSYATFVIRNGDALGMDLEPGDQITVQNARLQSRDLSEPLTRFIERAEGPDGSTLDLDRAFDSIGLNDDQQQRLSRLLQNAETPRIMTELLVDPNDLTVHKNGRNGS